VPCARAEDSTVNEPVKYSHKPEVSAIPEEALKALTTPTSIIRPADEIDAQFLTILSQYVESHVQLQEIVDRASNEFAEAVRAIDERPRLNTTLVMSWTLGIYVAVSHDN